MPKPKRPRRAETEPTSHVEPPLTAATRTEPRQPRVHFAADGMIDEPPASSWGRTHDAEPSDSRSLAELAASVMSAQHDVAAEAAQDLTPQSDSLVPPVQAPVRTRVQVTIGEPKIPARRRGAGAMVLLLVILGGLGVAWLHSNVNDSSSDGRQDGQLVAAPANAGSSGDGSSAPAAGGAPEEPGNAAAPIAPTPEPAPDQQTTPDPAAVPPAPTAAPAPAPVPPPPPPPPPPLVVHVGDLDGGPRGGKVFFQVFVVDSAQNPVEGVVVHLAWEGASGPSSCVTGATGSCTAHTSNLSSPAKVTLIVTGVVVAGGTYDAGSNQDADGDSNGTSITIST